MAFPAQSPRRPPHPPDLLTHLRKLRQALTCSVCNRLYQRPASLHCNHHFCMSCIVQSLESISACPKCKQPAAMRQAKFAPEMDSLVDIFLSLESAAKPVVVAKDSEDSQLENVLDAGHVPHNVKVEEECLSPSASKRQRRYESREQLSSNTKGAAEIDSRKRDASSMDTPCRGILPASKRIQLPGPPVPTSSATEALGSSPAKKDTTNESPVKRKQPPRLGGQGRNSGVAPFLQEEKPLLPTGIQGSNHEQEVSETTPGSRTNENASFHSNNHVQGENGMHAGLLNKDLQGFHKQDVKMQAVTAQSQLVDGTAQPNTVQIGFGAEKMTCAFCHKSESEVAGPMIQYKAGAPVSGSKKAVQTNYVHKNCAEWAPGVYYEDDVAKNIPQEVARGHKMKCFVCGLRGAVLGCYVKRCRKSFHYPCAHTLPCRWDEGNFLVFCPEHVASKFPDESLNKPGLKSVNVGNLDHAEERPKQTVYANGYGDQSGSAVPAPGDAYIPELPAEAQTFQESPSKHLNSKWVLCGSGLSPRANELMITFANYSGLTVEKSWTPFVTHLIVGTDEVGAARRTFKYLMANLEGIWILKIDWLSACMAANDLVNEEPYEVNLDIHGMIGGPRRARALSTTKVHRLFEGLTFYFLGEYVASFKADLQSLLTAGGGVVLTQMPDSSEMDSKSCIVLIYSKDMSVDTNANHREEVNRSRCVEAKLLAGMTGAKVAGHTWILDSVAAYELQPFE